MLYIPMTWKMIIRPMLEFLLSVFIAATLVIAAITYLSIATDFFSHTWLDYFDKKAQLEILGTFGDFVGGILNPLFALLAFLWLKKSVVMQKEELAETRDLLGNQRFETTFFNIMSSFDAITKSIKEKEKNGRFFFEQLVLHALSQDEPEKALRYIHDRFDEIELYVKKLYLVLRLIASQASSKQTVASKVDLDFLVKYKFAPLDDELTYADILKSSIGNYEAWLILLFCLAIGEDEEETNYNRFYHLKELIERYAILENIDFIDAPNAPALLALFSPSTFGSNALARSICENERQ